MRNSRAIGQTAHVAGPRNQRNPAQFSANRAQLLRNSRSATKAQPRNRTLIGAVPLRAAKGILGGQPLYAFADLRNITR